jgi:hypothetical protein
MKKYDVIVALYKGESLITTVDKNGRSAGCYVGKDNDLKPVHGNTANAVVRALFVAGSVYRFSNPAKIISRGVMKLANGEEVPVRFTKYFFDKDFS